MIYIKTKPKGLEGYWVDVSDMGSGYVELIVNAPISDYDCVKTIRKTMQKLNNRNKDDMFGCPELTNFTEIYKAHSRNPDGVVIETFTFRVSTTKERTRILEALCDEYYDQQCKTLNCIKNMMFGRFWHNEMNREIKHASRDLETVEVLSTIDTVKVEIEEFDK